MALFRIRKQTVWKIHSLFGLVAGLGLIVIGLTGSLLMFSKEIDVALRPEVVTVSPPPDGKRLPIDDLIGRVSNTFPGYQLVGWVPADKPNESDLAWMNRPGEDRWLTTYLDPYSGRILSRPAESGETFTGWILEMHHTLLAGHFGIAVAGIFAILLFFLGVTGMWLYRDFFRHLFRLRWGNSARIFFSDLHKLVGISSVVFNLILGFTGAWWNLSHFIGHLVEEHPKSSEAERAPVEWASLEAMLTDASRRIEGFQATYLGFPDTPDETFLFFGHHRDAGVLRSQHGSTISYSSDGSFLESSDIRKASAWAQIYDSFVPLHYGTFGGWPIRVLWCLGGLAPGTLAISGSFIWWSRRRRAGSSLRREQARASQPAPPSRRVPRDEAART